MITRPYTRLNGLKTMPFPAAHTRIANIWEYPPENGCILLYLWRGFDQIRQVAFACLAIFCPQNVAKVYISYIMKGFLQILLTDVTPTF